MFCKPLNHLKTFLMFTGLFTENTVNIAINGQACNLNLKKTPPVLNLLKYLIFYLIHTFMEKHPHVTPLETCVEVLTIVYGSLRNHP